MSYQPRTDRITDHEAALLRLLTSSTDDWPDKMVSRPCRAGQHEDCRFAGCWCQHHKPFFSVDDLLYAHWIGTPLYEGRLWDTPQGLHQTAASLVRKGFVERAREGVVIYRATDAGRQMLSSATPHQEKVAP